MPKRTFKQIYLKGIKNTIKNANQEDIYL